MNRILAALSRLLEPAERECVCGDLEELRFSASAAAANILGLVIRRQMAEWTFWGPWAALLGVARLAGSFLSRSVDGVGAGIGIQIRTYLQYGVAYEPGGMTVAQEITYAATAAVAMLLWSWGCGFVLAVLSRRAVWITPFLFYCVVRESWPIRLALGGKGVLSHGFGAAVLLRLLPLEPVVIAFLFALALGLRSARKCTLTRNASVCLVIAGLTFVVLLVWMDTWFAAGFARWSGQPYVPTSLLDRALPCFAEAWPVLSIPLLHAQRKELGSKRHEYGREFLQSFCSSEKGS